MKKMLNAALGACLAAGVTIGPAARADAPDAAPHQRFDLGDFPLESGQVIEKGFLTYVTHGSLNEQRNNAILVLPSLMGTHHRHAFLIGPG